MRANVAATFVVGWLGSAVLALAGSLPPASPVDLTAAPESPPRMALTFDDLPVHGSLPPGLSRSDVARSILDALRVHHAPPTYGFVNAKGLAGPPDHAEVLRLWRAAGHPLGNHTFSHMDLDANTPEAFEQDLLADEATLRTYMGDADWHWLRYPYLREGDTSAKRRAVTQFLEDHGYRVAQVTMSFDDYAYSDPYARCAAKGDLAAIDWMKQSYLRHAETSIGAGQEAARLVFGRDIAHVMLLHIGAFQTVMLPRLLDLIEERGFRLVTLEEAQSDPAYTIHPDEAASPSGGTFLDRRMAAKRIPPPTASDDALARLAALCR
jgi:peptidoglycan/xylan/chitin deacetylase (PgdA/CDA1 family)